MRPRSSMRVVSPARPRRSSCAAAAGISAPRSCNRPGGRFGHMDSPITSLHHVTATVDEAQPDVDFYSRALGLRLVKKTVNFDNHYVVRFYYGNEQGTPSTIMTTFPYHGWDVPVGVEGAGQIRTTSFSVPREALGFWRQRLEELGKAPRPGLSPRSEERRVGKECRSRWSPYH